MAHARSAYATRHGRLPAKSFSRNYEHVIDRIRHSTAIQYDEYRCLPVPAHGHPH
jgi:hypothetical protein